MFKSTKELAQEVFDLMKEKFGYKNPMQTPRLVKIVVSVGTGSFKDPSKLEIVEDRLAKITGQKPKYDRAKKSIATFKLRQGQVIGYHVTLRGKRMYQFLDKLIHVALPRTRDFRGLPLDSVDSAGNYTIGIKEHTIFPETSDEELKNVFGMGITLVTNTKNKEETLELLRRLGLPLKKESKE